ncbi:MAG: hypothetical protein AVDCRST_MAG88-789, partial [uncultured Thermomicrobiales bacterium]
PRSPARPRRARRARPRRRHRDAERDDRRPAPSPLGAGRRPPRAEPGDRSM